MAAAILAAVVAPSIVAPTSAIAADSLSTVADSWVDGSMPDANFGASTVLRIDGSPVRTAYLRFNVQGAGATASAELRLYFTTATTAPVEVRRVADNTWTETGLKYTNAPPVGSVLATVPKVAAGAWYAFDVSAAVTGDGFVSLAVTTAGETAVQFGSRESATKPQLFVPRPPPPDLFQVTNGGTVYRAESTAAAIIYTGTLKTVVESAVRDIANGGAAGTIRFAAGTFDLGSDYFRLVNLSNITFEGAGIDQTIIQNSSDAAADTEPFNMQTVTGLTIRDMTVAGRGAPRSTSDVLDFDQGNNSIVERVKITASRGKAIIFDGKDADWTSQGNIVRDCAISGVPGNGIEFLASVSNRVEDCTISDVGLHGIMSNKSSPTTAQPNKPSHDNVIIGNRIDNVGGDGILINSSNGNQVTSNTITNSSNIVTARDGIRIASVDGLSCNDTIVENNTASDNQSTKTQQYGLRIANSECNRTVVRGNTFTGNALGEIRDLGTGTLIETSTPTPTPTPTPAPGVITLTPVADTYVDALTPTTPRGTSTQIRVDGSPNVLSYLRFDVQGVTGKVTTAKLRLYANSASTVGHRVHSVASTTWSEGMLYADRPTVGAIAGSAGPFSAGAYREVDVTSLVTRNGLISLAVTTTSSTAISFGSRESTTKPKLVVTGTVG